jgi:pimeloyl-ACP methyl ester carboxylesterase
MERLAIETEIEKMLASSANLMYQTSKTMCTSDQVDGGSCEWYHSVWQYLRYLNMVSSPSWHSDFYIEEFNKLKSYTNPSIFISGTADYTILAYLEYCLKTQLNNVQFSVLDTCPTPLFACKWYARQKSFSIDTLPFDILNIRNFLPEKSQNVICADAFLTRFSISAVQDVISNWSYLLRPGGTVITTVRVHDHEKTNFHDAIENYKRKAYLEIKKIPDVFDLDPHKFQDMAEEYANKMHSENLGDADCICSYFEKAGFLVKLRKIQDVSGELSPSKYVQLVFIKPNDNKSYSLKDKELKKMNIKFDLLSTQYNDTVLHGLWYQSPRWGQGAAIHIHGTGGNFYLNPFILPTASAYASFGLNFLTANFPGHDETSIFENFTDFTEALDHWLKKVYPEGNIHLQGFSLGALKILHYLNDPLAKNRSRIKSVVLVSPFDIVAFYSSNDENRIRKAIDYREKYGAKVYVPEDVFSFWPISAGTFLEMTRTGNPSDLFASRNQLLNSPLHKISIPTFIAIGSEDFASYPGPTPVFHMVSGIQNKNIHAELFQGAPHTFTGHGDELANAVLAWMKKTSLWD